MSMKTHRTMVNLVVYCFLQQWEMKQLPQLSVWCLLLSREQLSNYQHPSYSHTSSTSCISWLINAAHFPPLQNVHFSTELPETVHDSVRSTHCGANTTCTYNEKPLNALMDISGSTWWKHRDVFVLFCLGSFHSAKVGLVCSHVWLRHLLAHTNDPNWESGLRFRVTDRLTGMCGMRPGGTRLLSGPPYQLAAYCNGHLPSFLSLLLFKSQMEKTDLSGGFLIYFPNNRLLNTCAAIYIPVLLWVSPPLWVAYRFFIDIHGKNIQWSK